ncbi:MAG: helix-turn-helix domain-containing protein [Clostridia bacterium]|nr:helix-turn-helix domain-containing protein [Clostridia bacterium]
MKIVEVMTLSGFTTENHFFAVFKKHYGLTPRAYRAKMTEI